MPDWKDWPFHTMEPYAMRNPVVFTGLVPPAEPYNPAHCVGRPVQAEPQSAGWSPVPLYVIVRDRHDGTLEYYHESSEHGCGWCDHPKEAYSPSVLAKLVKRLGDERSGLHAITIRQLGVDRRA
jgi:hypothetical protein